MDQERSPGFKFDELNPLTNRFKNMVAGEGFEPSKAEPGDLQSPPIGRSGNPPGCFYGRAEITAVSSVLEIAVKT